MLDGAKGVRNGSKGIYFKKIITHCLRNLAKFSILSKGTSCYPNHTHMAPLVAVQDTTVVISSKTNPNFTFIFEPLCPNSIHSSLHDHLKNCEGF